MEAAAAQRLPLAARQLLAPLGTPRAASLWQEPVVVQVAVVQAAVARPLQAQAPAAGRATPKAAG